MTEDEARALLRNFDAADDLERWITDQPWSTTPHAWGVPFNSAGWNFVVQMIPGGLRICAMPPDGGPPNNWLVPGP
jgi:hypothetical protein